MLLECSMLTLELHFSLYDKTSYRRKEVSLLIIQTIHWKTVKIDFGFVTTECKFQKACNMNHDLKFQILNVTKFRRFQQLISTCSWVHPQPLHLYKRTLRTQQYVSKSFKSKHWLLNSKSLPDQNGPQTPGMNSLLRDTAIWQVEVPQTRTRRWQIAPFSYSEHISLCEKDVLSNWSLKK